MKNRKIIFLYQKDIKNKHVVLSILKEISEIFVQSVKSLEQIQVYDKKTCNQGIVYECASFTKIERREIESLKKLHIPLLIIASNIDIACQNCKENIIVKPIKESMTFHAQIQINIKLMWQNQQNQSTFIAEEIPSTRLIGIGASTGGPNALTTILKELPINMCGIILVQHMTQANMNSFIEYLDRMCKLKVKEAQENEVVKNGFVYVAKQKQHLIIKKRKDGYHLHYTNGEKVNCVCPSIDILFHSMSVEANKDAAGVLLTGMGCDGAEGLSDMKNAGAFTIIQNEETSQLYSMPKEAKKRNAHQKELALQDISSCLIERYKCY